MQIESTTDDLHNFRMIDRDMAAELYQSAAEYPVVTVLGPRQSGKTTLARMAGIH